jgi:hypothetical protein
LKSSEIDATIHWDQLNQEKPKLHFIKRGQNLIHAIPCYNIDHVDIETYAQFFSNTSSFTAMMPTTVRGPLGLTDIEIIERPNLLSIAVSGNAQEQWDLLHHSKQRNINKTLKDIDLGICDETGHVREVFLTSFARAQVSRSTTISHFFDTESLNNVLDLPNTTLFYACSKHDRSSILFHLNFLIDDTCYYLFSSNTSEDSRAFSAALHWLVIEWLTSQYDYHYYSLGGGLSKADGIEKFKSQLGATAVERYYAVYPGAKYRPSNFFPTSHSFLSHIFLFENN